MLEVNNSYCILIKDDDNDGSDEDGDNNSYDDGTNDNDDNVEHKKSSR